MSTPQKKLRGDQVVVVSGGNRPYYQQTMTEQKRKIKMPQIDWRHATCTVCGKSFDYSEKRAPSVCRDGDCRYKHHYKIDPQNWANYQPTLFDSNDN